MICLYDSGYISKTGVITWILPRAAPVGKDRWRRRRILFPCFIKPMTSFFSMIEDVWLTFNFMAFSEIKICRFCIIGPSVWISTMICSHFTNIWNRKYEKRLLIDLIITTHLLLCPCNSNHINFLLSWSRSTLWLKWQFDAYWASHPSNTCRVTVGPALFAHRESCLQ